MRTLGVALLAALIAPPAAAAPRKAAPPKAPGVLVEGLEVRPKAECLAAKPEPGATPPKVISSYPAEGQVVRPGLLVVRLTFDQPMTCSGYLHDIEPFPHPCPKGPQRMSLTFDRRTLRTLCAVEPHTGYALRASEGDAALLGLYGEKAQRFELTFRTSEEAPVRSIPEALTEDPAYRPPSAR